MKTKILYIERKFWEFVSVEKVFRIIAENLNKEKFEFTFTQLPFGNSFTEIIKNLLFFRKAEAEIYHITGHIHYISLILPRKRTVLTIHDLGFLHTRKGFRRLILKKIFLDFPIKKLKYVTAISETTKSEIIKFTNCDEQKIRIIENPLRRFTGIKKKSFNSDCPIILQVGTAPNKNLKNLIEALNGITCKLRIIGKLDAPMLNCLNENNINYSNVFDLNDDEMEQEYCNADIVAFCSTFEGFGLPIIEGQANKTPVITSNLNPMKEVAGNAACLVNPFECKDIREGIIKIIEDDEYRNNLIALGIKNVRRFEPSKIVGTYEALYQEILSDI